MTELCHCGQPLHYNSKAVEDAINEIIKAKGSRFVEIELMETGKRFKVDVHYIALHGVKGELLDTYGFEEVKSGT